MFGTLISKIKEKIKHEGVENLVEKVVRSVQKINVQEYYKFVTDDTEIAFDANEKNVVDRNNEIVINWIIPEMGIGSGGHLNIFRFVSYLQRNGLKNRIYIFNSNKFKSNNELKRFLVNNYPIIDTTIEVFCNTDEIKFAHGTFATSWHTAYYVKRFNNTLAKFYFVQDFEPFFYAHGSEYSLAEETYNFGLVGITAGGWLKDKLSSEYNMECYDFGFSFDKELYKPIEKRDEVKRVLFYARPVTPRRSFEIGLLALHELYKKNPDIGIIFAGWDTSNYEIPFPYLNAGSVPIKELPDLYAQCDICMVLSNTNLSLLPLEVMACKSVVLSNDDDHVRWLLNEENSILAKLNYEDIAEKLEYFLDNRNELEKIRNNGFKVSMETSWIEEGEKVKSYIIKEIYRDERK